MDKVLRFNLLFIGTSIAAFIVACIAAVLGMIRVIGWSLGNCAASTNMCSVANWLISYWWLLFIPGVLVSAFVLRRVYDRALARLKRAN